jgi:fructuronate reductase
MSDPELSKMARLLGYVEGMDVVPDPVILSPKAFLDELFEERFPNRYLGDTSQRIAVDISQMTAIRFGETIKAYMGRNDLNVLDLKCIPFVFAGWLRYLMALDDNGNPFTPSPDPLLEEVTPYVKKFELGKNYTAEEIKKEVLPLLKNPVIFGTDLEECGLADRVAEDFAKLLKGKGAVRKALQEI